MTQPEGLLRKTQLHSSRHEIPLNLCKLALSRGGETHRCLQFVSVRTFGGPASNGLPALSRIATRKVFRCNQAYIIVSFLNPHSSN